ncbi:hypothetical protein EG240_05245 [Paenimyroides tangerinum]|uniref:Uncharacterized protein n=1 Tax=Paenimyroides tangerinum TaxID=2488728 RepID=A0A3P3WC48_9FLAO|nr:hypothetical protein [Paenimyroides tangerinum]RRJ91606.1 hypothetical protein EG240_05245 [Paenimyroides tangerinum]
MKGVLIPIFHSKLIFKQLNYDKKIFLGFSLLFLSLACNKDDEASDPGNFQTPLPEATQTGKGTFACYVDGKAYIAKKNEITAYYQYVQGHYTFGVAGTKEERPLWNIAIGSTADALTEGNTYTLRERERERERKSMGRD